MLAMDVNDDTGCLNAFVVPASIASMLAPMYGLAPTFNPFLNTDTRLHLCIRPVRGSIFGFWPKLVELAVCRLQ